ncbi:3-keto-5-aminohexanoate cleavage protein [Chloroflexota bacterium]
MLDPWNYSDQYQYMRKVARSDMQPLIITVAVTGLSGKEDNQNVPETPREQADDAHRCYQAGATSVHIHARDDTGAKSIADAARFRDINRMIRELCPDMIIGNTTGIGPDEPRERAVNVLEAEPELCSLNMGPVCFVFDFKERKPPLQGRDKATHAEFVQPFGFTDQERIARRALEKNIKPEMEIYNNSMFFGIRNLIQNNLLKKPYWIQAVFSPFFIPPTIEGMANAISLLPTDSLLSVIGVGPFQLNVAVAAIIAGCHVRVGLEDNLFYRKGEMATNARLVERIVRIAQELGRDIATPTQAREMLGISSIPTTY